MHEEKYSDVHIKIRRYKIVEIIDLKKVYTIHSFNNDLLLCLVQDLTL